MLLVAALAVADRVWLLRQILRAHGGAAGADRGGRARQAARVLRARSRAAGRKAFPMRVGARFPLHVRREKVTVG